MRRDWIVSVLMAATKFQSTVILLSKTETSTCYKLSIYVSTKQHIWNEKKHFFPWHFTWLPTKHVTCFLLHHIFRVVYLLTANIIRFSCREHIWNIFHVSPFECRLLQNIRFSWQWRQCGANVFHHKKMNKQKWMLNRMGGVRWKKTQQWRWTLNMKAKNAH